MIFLQTHLVFSIIMLAAIGLAVGSFLNVVILRYPEMLMRRWRADCREFLNLPAEPRQPTFNLALPGSQCPNCRHRLPFWHNVPLISYLALRGRCGFCRQRISIQYPVIELITALATLAVFFEFGWQLKTLLICLMTWALIALSAIDWKAQILPDDITLTLLWIGLIINIGGMFIPLPYAVLGTVTGYILLAVVAGVFKIVRKKPGMGNGDFKMLAMFGAWLGPSAMLQVLLIAVVLSLIVNLSLLWMKKIHRDQPLPFGPWLAISGWLTLMLSPFFNTGILN